MRQDEYCARAIIGDWVDLGDFPEVLEWESLVDVLRGRVKVILTIRLATKDSDKFLQGSRPCQRGCRSRRHSKGKARYPSSFNCRDFILLPKLSNEFKFSIAAFHHAAEAYLVPDVLRRAYGMRIPFIDFMTM